MACPLFMPASPLAGFVAEAMPLGDLYGGQCAADPAAIVPADTLRRCCNTGYARGVCERAAGAEADAMRFLIKARHGNTVEVAWAIERNHHPVAVGSVQIAGATPADAAPLERQARACAAAYLRQIGAA